MIQQTTPIPPSPRIDRRDFFKQLAVLAGSATAIASTSNPAKAYKVDARIPNPAKAEGYRPSEELEQIAKSAEKFIPEAIVVTTGLALLGKEILDERAAGINQAQENPEDKKSGI